MQGSVAPCVALVPLFQGLTLDEQRAVEERAVPIRRRAGETIHRPGENLSQLIIVHRGQVRVSQITPSGQERLARVLGPGDFMGEDAFISGSRPTTLATALTDVQLCSFQHAQMQTLVRQHPDIVLRMLQTLSARLESAERFITELTSSDVSSRVARYLTELPASQHQGVLRVQLPLTKKDIASLLGMTPETLSRQLQRLGSADLIRVDGAEIDILNAGQLLAVADGTQS